MLLLRVLSKLLFILLNSWKREQRTRIFVREYFFLYCYCFCFFLLHFERVTVAVAKVLSFRLSIYWFAYNFVWSYIPLCWWFFSFCLLLLLLLCATLMYTKILFIWLLLFFCRYCLNTFLLCCWLLFIIFMLFIKSRPIDFSLFLFKTLQKNYGVFE